MNTSVLMPTTTPHLSSIEALIGVVGFRVQCKLDASLEVIHKTDTVIMDNQKDMMYSLLNSADFDDLE